VDLSGVHLVFIYIYIYIYLHSSIDVPQPLETLYHAPS
jgi:hypothetical protein